jgi:hypothetical protein
MGPRAFDPVFQMVVSLYMTSHANRIRLSILRIVSLM